MKILIAGILSGLIVISANAQSDSPLKELEQLQGQWHGPSWYMTREGRSDSMVTENVRCQWDCELIIVEGKGQTTNEQGKPQTAHQALGVIHYDASAQQIMMRAYAQGRGATDSPVEKIANSTYRWFLSLPHNSGQLRYTLDLSEENTWSEKGEFSRDGKQWHQIMEMTLTKTK
ncbi:hypothetical protein QWI17_12065 [Gilvimarinus sp. SDUM040013]|uniref:Lipocalin-like domain-containing protein n=1 Tax=Gilvimarinus gilvus TaxID=3058038 RepID=A0ABU4RW98_9GAMM|nr:hypothetical protein [Gilvimarinus sp. SDUM040013]MDO3386572.1 hypothetical protein [Gilvimarinus sp. SDUM040013]MDX6849148.1 hypothetical protein [Gilvimarinus sp. SDUM040013]